MLRFQPTFSKYMSLIAPPDDKHHEGCESSVELLVPKQTPAAHPVLACRAAPLAVRLVRLLPLSRKQSRGTSSESFCVLSRWAVEAGSSEQKAVDILHQEIGHPLRLDLLSLYFSFFHFSAAGRRHFSGLKCPQRRFPPQLSGHVVNYSSTLIKLSDILLNLLRWSSKTPL